jgi:hypothetical protein
MKTFFNGFGYLIIVQHFFKRGANNEKKNGFSNISTGNDLFVFF